MKALASRHKPTYSALLGENKNVLYDMVSLLSRATPHHQHIHAVINGYDQQPHRLLLCF